MEKKVPKNKIQGKTLKIKNSKPEKKKKEKEIKILEKPLGALAKIGLGKERDYIIENVSALVGAGIGIISSLKSIYGELKTTQMKRVVKTIIHDLALGGTMHKAMDSTGIFSVSEIALVRIGEETGQLAKNLEVIALQNRKNRIFKSKIRSAMMYPIIVLVVVVVVGLGVAWFILPKLSKVFSSLDLELPFLTRMIIGFGDLLQNHGTILVPAILIFMFSTIYLLFLNSKTKHIGQAILFKTPGISALLKQVEIARMGYLLSLLLKSGVPVMQSLDSFASTASLAQYRRFYLFLANSVRSGISFQKSFKMYDKNLAKLIPTPIQQMIIVGEQSGRLADMLGKVSDIYEVKAEASTKNLSVIIEPFLMIIIFGGVLMLAIGVITPLYGLLQGLR